MPSTRSDFLSVKHGTRFYIQSGNCLVEEIVMGIFDYFRKRETDKMCPECEKHQKHVKMVETEGKQMECPECHYLHVARR